MATYSEIHKFVQRHHGFIPKTGSIMSRLCGAYRRTVRRTALVGVVASYRARPKSVRQSNRLGECSAPP
jgi:hypothetical protein